MKEKFGILGCNISYTRSPMLHGFLGGYGYNVYDIKIEKLKSFFEERDFKGVNVTVPYKTECIKYLQDLSLEAQAIGAVNTVVNQNGILRGYNTDYFGFLAECDYFGINLEHKNVVVLGGGGAAQAVIHGARARNAKTVRVVSRQGEINYDNVYEKALNAQVIINATPVGRGTLESLVDLTRFPQVEAVIDLIYSPFKTKLVLDALELGKKAEGGAYMLVAQAAKASQLFVGEIGQSKKIFSAYKQLERELNNIVLIGMAGAGKSAVGRLLAQKTGREFIDTDAVIEKVTGKTIPQIFAHEGESVFRELERQVIAEVAGKTNAVISTGGGAVLNKQNRYALRKNGITVFIKRDLDKCDFKGRPLFENGGATQVYAQREPVYNLTADVVVKNDGTIEQTVQSILEKIL